MKEAQAMSFLATRYRAAGVTQLLILPLAFMIAGCSTEPQESLQEYSKNSPPPLLHQPAEFHSINGVLTATLEATEQKVTLGHTSIDAAVYNGEYAGPVLRVHQGDVMKIHLVNHLSRQTNLHFHGMHSSPLGNGDNVHIVVNPGESFDYQVKILNTQPPGLYWYHDHIHHNAEKNVMDGLSGALIVEGLPQQFPELGAIKEQLFVLKDYQLDNHPDPVYHKLLQTVNGQTYSQITMRPHETQLWRFTNQSANLYFDLSLKGTPFRILAKDGVAATTEQDVDVLKIAPSSRVEALVTAGDAGTTTLVSENTVTGSGSAKTAQRPLVQVNVAGEPTTPAPAQLTFPASKDLRGHTINTKRSFVFTQMNDDLHYFINGKMFDHARIDTRVPLGNVEEWTVVNKTHDTHIFHIHQLSFQVAKINDQPQPFTGYVDTIRVPEMGKVTLIMPFTDPAIVGHFMYHCHVLRHEDHGMMANIEVYDPHAPAAPAMHHHMPDL